MSGFWYLLDETQPRDAASNMAADQYLLDLIETGAIQVPILRLYAWQQPTLSLGFHQRWTDTVNREALDRHGVALVRRWTGGRGVLHEPDEITYSVCAPLIEPFRTRVTHNYRLIGAALERFSYVPGTQAVMSEERQESASVRAQRGLPCFASISESEIESRGQKLIGSAQKLGKQSFLQHGSIPRVHRSQILNEVTGSLRDVSALMTGLDDLYQQVGQQTPDRQTLAAKLIQAFADIFAIEFRPLSDLGLPDEAQIAELAQSRFSQDSWTFRK